MIGVGAGDGSMVVRDFIGNPSAASHDLKNCNSMPSASFERARLVAAPQVKINDAFSRLELPSSKPLPTQPAS
jgi:hypothetical protein